MSQIQQVKDAADIVAVIGNRLDLKRAGQQYRALCPFHSEKSPSFFVNESFQRYRCFGCGESGDVFEFLQKYEGMTFYESLQYLADEAGITLESYRQTDEDKEREKLQEVLDLARQYYHFLLTEHKAGEPARKYLKNRGVTQDSIKLFQLGYGVDQWDSLYKYLHGKKKYSDQVLENAGLIIRGRRGFYDRFRGRIMFPLKNHRGQVVGFSGRLLDPEAKEAKYINSPETKLYHKSKMLYGYSELFQDIRKTGKVIVAEGEFDVISSVQGHVPNIVAIKGSALTQEHAQLLSRTAQSVLLALDTDAAGVEATRKALRVLKEHEIDVYVVVLPEGKDPDDLVRRDPKIWREVVKKPISAYEFLIRAALAEHDAASPDGKRYIMKELLPILVEVTHAVEREFYIKRLAEALNVKESVITQDVQTYRQKMKLAQTDRSDRNQQKRSDAMTTKEPDSETNSKKNAKSSKQRLEEYALWLLFHANSESIHEKSRALSTATLQTTGAPQLLKAVEKFDPFDLEAYTQSLPDDLQETLFSVYTDQEFGSLEGKIQIDEEWQTTLAKLKQQAVHEKIDSITQELGALDQKREKTPDEEEREETLLAEIVKLKATLKTIE